MSFIENLFGKCEKCGRSFAVKKSEKTLVMREDIKIADLQAKGGYIPGEKMYYREESKCKFCGDESVKYTTKEVKKC